MLPSPYRLPVEASYYAPTPNRCGGIVFRSFRSKYDLLRRGLRDIHGMHVTVLSMSDDELLTTAQVAQHFKVDASAVRRWVDAGKLVPAVTTPGGHYRFTRHDIDKLGTATC